MNEEASTALRRRLQAATLRWLSRRDYTYEELRQKSLIWLKQTLMQPLWLPLAETWYCDNEWTQAAQTLVQDVMDSLRHRGWQNDARVAEGLVHRKQHQWGMRRMVATLQQRHTNPDDIREQTAALAETEYDRAWQIWFKKFGHLSNLSLPRDQAAKAKAQQMRYLATRGFEPSIIMQVLKRSQSLDIDISDETQ